MKNPAKIRKMTDNICILEAALSGMMYKDIAKHYSVSPCRVPQIVCCCIKRISKGIDTPLKTKVNPVYKKEDVILHRDEILRVLYLYSNQMKDYGIKLSQALTIRDYAVWIAKSNNTFTMD